MYRSAVALALGVYLLAVIGAVTTSCSTSARRHSAPWTDQTAIDDGDDLDLLPPPPATTTAPAASQRIPWDDGRPLIGFAISFHHTDNLKRYLDAVDELAALGFNAVEVVTPAFQADGASTDIRVEVGPEMSPRREHLVQLLQRARARGLRTALMPIVLFSNPRGNEWRGKISPDDWNAWWKSYRRFHDYFIDIGNEAQVSAFSVGSELLSTEKPEHARRWGQVIARVRARMPGVKLYYSTNWDHYHVPSHWKYVDMIGINGYWDLTRDADSEKPDAAALAKRWREIREQVTSFAEKENKPVLFTEIGYPSLPWGLKDPWNYVNTTNDKADVQVQALGIASFLHAFSDLLGKPAPKELAPPPHAVPPPNGRDRPLAGVFFYSWEPWAAGGPDDTGYGVKGKPALQILRNWVNAPPATQPTAPADTPH